MLSSSSRIFEPITSDSSHLAFQAANYILKSVFSVNKTDIVLLMTENYLIITECFGHHRPTHFCRLAFEIKFQIIYQKISDDESLGIPVAFKLERENTTEVINLIAVNSSVMEAWAIQLQKRINQRNFHKLFKAKKKIGKGAFATVYLAERLRDGKLVAVKAFSKQKQYSSDKGRESLENQIKLMRKLNHSNIMKLEGVYQTQNSIYVILEYLEGTQLNELLKSGRKLENYQIYSIIQNILKGLSHLAKNRIIHRDLKPENIMFRKENSNDLSICDFGLATYAEEEKYLFVRCGTPGFVAPQIINIKDMSTKSDPISDVFSAGVIFHYLLFGQSIFQGKKYNQILTQNRACDFNFSKEMYHKINHRALDLLKKMLEKDPFKRISAQSALKHSYFSDEMQIEDNPTKRVLRELTNQNQSQYYPIKKEIQDAATTFTKKHQHRVSFHAPYDPPRRFY